MDELRWWNQPPHDAASGAPDATQPVPALPNLDSHLARNRGKPMRWAAMAIAALALASTGALAGLELSHAGTGQDSQAAILNAALNGSTGVPGAVATRGPAARARAARAARILSRLRGLHGEFTVAKRIGGFREIAFERGVVEATSSGNVVVRAADGTTWTWTLTSNTIVRKNHAKSAPSSLVTSDRVFVAGQQNGSVRDARLIIVPEKTGTSGTASGSAAGSSASTSS